MHQHHPISPAFASSHTENEVAAIALDQALDVADTTMGNVQLVDWGKGSTLRMVSQRGFDEAFVSRFASVSMDEPTACGRALLYRSAIVIRDVREDREFAPFRDDAERAGFRSVQSTPMLSSGGALVGMLSTHAAEPGAPSVQQLKALRAIAQAAADAIVRFRVIEHST